MTEGALAFGAVAMYVWALAAGMQRLWTECIMAYVAGSLCLLCIYIMDGLYDFVS